MNNQHGHHKKMTSFFVNLSRILPDTFIRILYSLFRNVGGNIGLGIRYVCLKRLAKKCGENVALFPFVTLRHIENMSIGDNVSIHTMCYLDALGGIEIGNNVSIAHSSSLVSFDHTYNDIEQPIKYNDLKFGRITVEDDVWIGCGSRILQGVTIPKRCIIAAGSVVVNSTESNTIYGGVPAKMIKNIGKK